METHIEKESGALGGLFQQIIHDMKVIRIWLQNWVYYQIVYLALYYKMYKKSIMSRIESSIIYQFEFHKNRDYSTKKHIHHCCME